MSLWRIAWSYLWDRKFTTFLTILSVAQQAAGAQQWLAGKEIRKKLYVPKKLVNFVIG